MVNSTGIMGQLENGSPVSSNHQKVNGGGYNPYTGVSGGSISQATPTGPLNGSDTLANLADLLGNNPGFPDFGSRPQLDPEIISRMQQPLGPQDGPGFGSLPPPQAVGGGMQPSTPGFDTNTFSTSILSGVGDLFKEYMGPQQETMPGALPIGSINGGINIGLPDPNDTGFMPDGRYPATPDGFVMPNGSPGFVPRGGNVEYGAAVDFNRSDFFPQQEILQQYEGNTPSIQPDAYGFDGPTTGTGTLQEKQLANDGMNTNYNNASGIQSAFRGF